MSLRLRIVVDAFEQDLLIARRRSGTGYAVAGQGDIRGELFGMVIMGIDPDRTP